MSSMFLGTMTYGAVARQKSIDLGVETNPIALDGLGISPLFSWYHESFDKEEEITNIRIPPLEMACKDFSACRWSGELNGDISLALYFDAMNDKNQNLIEEIQNTCSQIITFSHFVPRQAFQRRECYSIRSFQRLLALIVLKPV